jgi:Leucine-rich repeat (LRR) protein
LAIRGWPLGQIPAVLLQLEQLDSLTLRRCELGELPKDWHLAIGLRHLDVSHNSLTRAPASLARLACLRELILAGNPIVELDLALAELGSLERLDLDDTALTSIPKAIAELPQLRVLSCARTPQSADRLKFTR